MGRLETNLVIRQTGEFVNKVINTIGVVMINLNIIWEKHLEGIFPVVFGQLKKMAGFQIVAIV